MRKSAVVFVAMAVVFAGCGGRSGPVASGETPEEHTNTSVTSDCVPDGVSGVPPINPDRRIEAIVELMTGQRQTGDEDAVEETVDDPNLGGVWGDRRGGVAVAVLDCSKVDANELARIAGGTEYLHLIEVPFTFKQVDGFRDALVHELKALGVAGDVFIESTLTGRRIEVHVLDVEQLPEGFGAGIPTNAFTIVVTKVLVTEE